MLIFKDLILTTMFPRVQEDETLSAEYTFKEELKSLDVLQNEVEQQADELRKFIASEKFLEDPIEFERLFGKFQAKKRITFSCCWR